MGSDSFHSIEQDTLAHYEPVFLEHYTQYKERQRGHHHLPFLSASQRARQCQSHHRCLAPRSGQASYRQDQLPLFSTAEKIRTDEDIHIIMTSVKRYIEPSLFPDEKLQETPDAEEKEYDIRQHARDFVAKRLAPAVIPNDGKQTPMRGHPVFLAQHATGCCCRGCFSKWHNIPAGRELTKEEQNYAVSVLMAWIEKQISKQEISGASQKRHCLDEIQGVR